MKHIRMAALSAALGASMAVQAAPMTVAIGQSQYFSTPNRNITIQNISSKLQYSVGQYYDGIDCNTVMGMVGFTQAYRLDVTTYGSSGVQKAFIGCGYDVEEFYLSSLSVNGKATSITVDDITGAVINLNGIHAGTTTGNFIRYLLTGGTYTAKNITASLSNNTLYGDFTGKRFAVGTKAEINYNLPNTPIWTYESAAGPMRIPVELLTNQTNYASTLTSAGFSVLSKTETSIKFQGTYKFSKLSPTPNGIDAISRALGLSASGRNQFTDSTDLISEPADWGALRPADGFGDLTITVTFSMPLTP